MATFMQKALQYLGLKDIEDEDFYDDEEDFDQEAPAHRTSYPEQTEHAPAGPPATVRPLVSGVSRERGVVRPMVSPRTSKPQVIVPQGFADAQQIGDLVKANNPVIVNLQASDRDLARRLVDFCSGLAYALSGTLEKVAERVFLLTPSNVEVSQEERQRLSERGLF